MKTANLMVNIAYLENVVVCVTGVPLRASTGGYLKLKRRDKPCDHQECATLRDEYAEIVLPT
ncbi:MAG TPA: hypothetical protein VLV18_03820 [Terriglobales bacterium]|nr:hypothetical protein [Terriglobales bacterium]